jgi:internalin A
MAGGWQVKRMGHETRFSRAEWMPSAREPCELNDASTVRGRSALLKEFEAHLTPLVNENWITPLHRRKTHAGENWLQMHSRHLNKASVILLLISADFFASQECLREMQDGLKRCTAGNALVIPILLRPIDQEGLPFKHLLCLLRNNRPVTT